VFIYVDFLRGPWAI